MSSEIIQENNDLPYWVQEANKLPIAFAQVREDALIEESIAKRLDKNSIVALVASGGCTAALLATLPNISQLQLIDPNPSQLALTRLKIKLLQSCSLDERSSLLGHRPMLVEERKNSMAQELAALGLAEDALGSLDFVARAGADYSGRYECLFAALQEALDEQADELTDILSLSDTTEQSHRVSPTTAFGQLLDQALDVVMALPNLVNLFGAEATSNPVLPFSRHFANRIRHAFATLPAANNPYLWQMLYGCYPASAFSPWLSKSPPVTLPEIVCRQQFMLEALQNQPNTFDFIQMSNILDWLSEEQATTLLDVAHQALKPGGWVLIRQLNSSLNISKLGFMFAWHMKEAQTLHLRDRSFFYRALHLGKKR